MVHGRIRLLGLYFELFPTTTTTTTVIRHYLALQVKREYVFIALKAKQKLALT